MRKTYNFSRLLAAAFLLLFVSCDKSKEFEMDAVPGQNFDVEIQTLDVSLKTKRHDSIKTNNLSRDLIGSISDPVLGRATASAYAQLRLETFNPGFSTTDRLDSVVLYLRYAGSSDFTGKPSSVQTWNIYEVTQKLEPKEYFSTSQVQLSGSTIGKYTGSFSPSNDVLRIKLDAAFGNKLLSGTAANYTDNTTFLDFIKGIAVVPEQITTPGEGAIIHFDLRNVNSQLILYFNDTGKYNFNINNQSVKLNTYKHDYSATLVQQQLDDPANSFDKVYLHAMGGLQVNVDLTNLAKFSEDGTKVIHQAELVFPKDEQTATMSSEPAVLLLYPASASGGNEFVTPAYNYSFTDHLLPDYGGRWRENEKSYSFIVTGHIQNLLKRYRNNAGYKDDGMNLFIPPDNPVSSSGIVLANKSAANGAGPRLVLTYTKLNDK